MAIDQDALSRNRIVSDTSRNFFVEAGAGSGKTTMLVSRMVAMVESGCDIRKICAITFTKAAAGEFYDRFQKLLIERSNPFYVWENKGYPGQLAAPTDETREKCRKALQDLNLCFMGTIDAFCNMVLSEHPSEAGVPSDATIMNDGDLETLYRQIYVQISNGMHGTTLQDLEKSYSTLYRSPQEVFVKGMQIFMNHRNVSFELPMAKGAVDIDTTFGTERTEVLAAVDCMLKHPELQYQKDKGNLAAWEELPNAVKVLRRRWSLDFDRVVRSLKSISAARLLPEALDRYGVSFGGQFEPGGAKGAWLEWNMKADGGLISKLNDLRYGLTMEFLSECVPIVEEALRDKGSLSYFDYLYYLRNMLAADAAKDGKLIQYIYDRHSYFLIDEFQDTNPMQAEVFYYLTAENPAAKWTDCVPKQGALFIVGDPKQSIYRFRSADVASFLKVKKLFVKNGGEILQLSRNFRSIKSLCSYFNETFEALLSEETRDQSKFESIPLPDVERADEFQGIYRYKAYTGKAAELYPEQRDAVQIVSAISSLVGNDAYQIRGQNEKDLRQIRYSDIMVIVSAKAKLGPIMELLKEHGIPSRVEGKVPFENNEALYAIWQIYAAVAEAGRVDGAGGLGNDYAIYGALTGSLVGLAAGDVQRYKDAGGRLNMWSTLPDEVDRSTATTILTTEEEASISKVCGAMRELRNLYLRARKLSPAALLSVILDDYRVYQVAAAENLEVVYYTLELLRNAERAGTIVNLMDGSAYLQKLLGGGADEERCLSLQENVDAVHLANLHKVKGLEAPVVILAASSGKGAHKSSFRVEHGDTGSQGWIFAIKEKSDSGNDFSYCESGAYKGHEEAESVSAKAEKDRLIYVAATRARNALILSDSYYIARGSDVSDTLWKPLFEAGSKDLWEVVKPVEATTPTVEEIDATSLYEEVANNSVFNDRSGEAGGYLVENPSRTRIQSKMESVDAGEGDVETAGNAGGAPVELGAEGAVESRNSDAGSENGAAESGDVVSERENGAAESENGTGGLALTETVNNGSGQGIEGGSGSKLPSRYAALMGTLTHRLMEILVTTKNICDVDLIVPEIIREFRTEATRSKEDVFAELLKGVAETMRNGGYAQTNGMEQDLLTKLLAADEVHCEVPFCYQEENGDPETGLPVVWNGIMDLIYREGQEWHIVDYKTNADGNDLDQKYQKQLRAYVKAYKAITGEDADAATYHIDI